MSINNSSVFILCFLSNQVKLQELVSWFGASHFDNRIKISLASENISKLLPINPVYQQGKKTITKWERGRRREREEKEGTRDKIIGFLKKIGVVKSTLSVVLMGVLLANCCCQILLKALFYVLLMVPKDRLEL
ncbi:unnamed protein product [Lactuca saligna]|uniref:Uncharacterized protein n=1 Tax=Lactuca saligna TaxID=75948 RepID=A0AA35YFE9_LACSI|nr:unnamed protein product [Lactuca saligna]